MEVKVNWCRMRNYIFRTTCAMVAHQPVHNCYCLGSVSMGTMWTVRWYHALFFLLMNYSTSTWVSLKSDWVVNLQDIWNTTWYPKAADHVTTEKTWYVVDATDKILGRLASTIAVHIRGKNEPTYTPSVDMGAFVIVVSILSIPIVLVYPLWYSTSLMLFDTEANKLPQIILKLWLCLE